MMYSTLFLRVCVACAITALQVNKKKKMGGKKRIPFNSMGDGFCMQFSWIRTRS